MKTLVAVILAALMCTAAQFARADYAATEVTWQLSPNAPPFTFESVLLTPYLFLGFFGPSESGIAPDGHTYRVFGISGFVDMSVFQLHGVTTQVPSAGYPSSIDYSIYMYLHGEGIIEDDGNMFFFGGNPPNIRMTIGPVSTFTNSSVSPPGQLNPLAEGVFQTIAGLPAANLTYSTNSGAVESFQFTASLAPLQPPFISSFWISPVIGLLQVSINGNAGIAVFLSAVPEPNRCSMLLLGLAMLGLLRGAQPRKKCDVQRGPLEKVDTPRGASPSPWTD